MRQITRISPCALTGEYDAQNNPQYGYKEEIIVGADALRFRNGEKNNSCVMGIGTTANAEGQVIVGKYNKESNALFVVGNGTEDAKKGNIAEFYNDKVMIKGNLNVTQNVIIDQSITVQDATIKGALKNSTNQYYAIADNYYTKTDTDNKFLSIDKWNSKLTGSSDWSWTTSTVSSASIYAWIGFEDGKTFFRYDPANFYVNRAKNADYSYQANALAANKPNSGKLNVITSNVDTNGITNLYVGNNEVSTVTIKAGNLILYPTNTDNKTVEIWGSVKIDGQLRIPYLRQTTSKMSLLAIDNNGNIYKTSKKFTTTS